MQRGWEGRLDNVVLSDWFGELVSVWAKVPPLGCIQFTSFMLICRSTPSWDMFWFHIVNLAFFLPPPPPPTGLRSVFNCLPHPLSFLPPSFSKSDWLPLQGEARCNLFFISHRYIIYYVIICMTQLLLLWPSFDHHLTSQLDHPLRSLIHFFLEDHKERGFCRFVLADLFSGNLLLFRGHYIGSNFWFLFALLYFLFIPQIHSKATQYAALWPSVAPSDFSLSVGPPQILLSLSLPPFATTKSEFLN